LTTELNQPIFLLDADLFVGKTKTILAFNAPIFKTTPQLRVQYTDLNREGSFVIFVSHHWVTAKSPDDQYRSKHQLLQRVIAQLQQGRVKDKKLYLWIDYCCLPEGRTAAAMQMLPAIIERCDAVITPVVENSTGKSKWWQHNDQRSGFDNLFEEYQSPSWKHYKADAWCAAESWLAAKQPLHPDCHHFFAIQTAKNSAANQDTSRAADRVHFLYGEREAERNIPPYVLNQLQASALKSMNPAKGKLYNEKDRPKVKAVLEVIQVLVQAAPLSPRSRGRLLSSANPRISWKGVEFYTARINDAPTTVRMHQVAKFRQ
jgi:hypothetical protein